MISLEDRINETFDIVQNGILTEPTLQKLITLEFMEEAVDTCKSVDEVIDFINEFSDIKFDITEEMLNFGIIDELIFICDNCGWWRETDGWGESCDGICSQCKELME